MQSTRSETLTTKIIWLEGQVPEEQIQKRKDIKTQEQKSKKQCQKKSVQWTEDTIDNEQLNKKKSNICCIYHKPHEKQGSSSSETCTSDDETNDLERDRSSKLRHKQICSKIQKQSKCCH